MSYKLQKESLKKQQAEKKKREIEVKERLIDSVRKQDEIWDRTKISHRNRDHVQLAWDKVSEEMRLDSKYIHLFLQLLVLNVT